MQHIRLTRDNPCVVLRSGTVIEPLDSRDVSVDWSRYVACSSAPRPTEQHNAEGSTRGNIYWRSPIGTAVIRCRPGLWIAWVADGDEVSGEPL